MLRPDFKRRPLPSWRMISTILLGTLIWFLTVQSTGFGQNAVEENFPDDTVQEIEAAVAEHGSLADEEHALVEMEAEHGEEHSAGHSDPIALVLLELLLVLLAAKIGGHFAEKFHQPAVLGELLIGVAIGSATLFWDGSALSQTIHAVREEGSYLDMVARLGVVLLLFEVGLETSVKEMMKVGWLSFIVAVVGVVAPFLIGYGVSVALITDFPPGLPPGHGHMFVGAILCATSVGITARVFKDLGKLQTREAKVILGAAVIDDVIGLVILAVVAGIIVADENGVEASVVTIASITTLKAIVFLGLAIFLGLKLAPYGFRLMAKLRGAHLLVATALIFCFLLAYLANAVGLATIVGAFAAGLVLEESHIRPFLTGDDEEHAHDALGHQLHPLSALVVPVFFVLMGIQVQLETFAQVDVLVLAALLTVAAIVGKQVCGLPIKGGIWSKLTVGFGMIPRGEVGLIFAAIGRGLGVVSPSVFSAVVIMVIVTTLITPPLLRVSMFRIPEESH
ncbi:cation:proton antiporter [bacterium]|nr:cation:proton antiporter [bacterium]